MAGKWLELLEEVAPGIDRVAILSNPKRRQTPNVLNTLKIAALSFTWRRTQPCSRSVRARIGCRRTGTRAEWQPDRDDRQLHDCSSRGDHSAGDTLLSPAVYPYCFFAELGGLLSYGVT